MNDTNVPTRPLRAVLDLMHSEGLHGFIVPQADEFQGEYISDDNMRLRWLTGFTGSAGTAVLYGDKGHLFVDGRYTLQAAQQVDPALVEVHHFRDPTPAQWLQRQVGAGDRIGYDPRLHGIANIEALKKALEEKQAAAVAVDANPIDRLWTDRPPPPFAPVRHHGLKYSGRASEDKIKDIADCLEDADAIVLNEMDSIAWTLNIRGGDTAYTPLVQSYAIIHADRRADLFANRKKFSEETLSRLGSHISLHDMNGFPEAMAALGKESLTVVLDRGTATDWMLSLLRDARAKVVFKTDPGRLLRARKNETEIAGARAAHRRDGLAMARLLKWFDDATAAGSVSELEVAAKAEELRGEQDLFRGLSFSTIAGAGPNGAIVHYMATAESNRVLEPDSLLLLDSGGQYLDGTTDVTRTLPVGSPGEPVRRHFTLVLKGHIAMASTRFPVGTNGGQLDALARQHLWRAGLNYDHGTGHGVGSYLGVHEGPHRLSAGSSVPLEAGMVVSNEPGLYLKGQYGIRIESLLLVRQWDAPESETRFLEFDPLTLVPLDRRLIDRELLDGGERLWLDGYHRRIFDTLGPDLEEADRAWLEHMCAPI